MGSLIYLWEASYIDDADLSLKTAYFAESPGYNAHDAPGYYAPVLKVAANVERHAFPNGQTVGTLSALPSVGLVQVLNVAKDLLSAGPYDALLNKGLDGQLGRLLLVDPSQPYSSVIVVLTGTQQQLEDEEEDSLTGDGGAMSFLFRDPTTVLDLPFLTDTFKGTNSGATGVEGTMADLVGKPYPWSWGFTPNVTFQPANAISLVYQGSYRGVAAIGGIWVKGAAIKPGVKCASLAALLASTPTGGTYNYYLGSASDGCYIKLGSQPDGAVTGNVLGDTRASSQFVSNGDFSSGTGWTAGSGWAISGGYANATASSGTLSEPLSGLTVGREYVVCGTLTNVSGGTLTVSVDSGTPAMEDGAGLGQGVFTCYFTATATAHTLKFTGAALTGVLGNVSCGDATLANIFQQLVLLANPAATVSAADIAAANSKQGAVTGVFVDQPTTFRPQIELLKESYGGFYFCDSSGAFRLQRVEDPAAGTAVCRILAATEGQPTLSTDCDIVSIAQVKPNNAEDPGPNAGVPAYQIVVNGGRNWTTQNPGDLLNTAEGQQRSAFTSQVFRTSVKIDGGSSTSTLTVATGAQSIAITEATASLTVGATYRVKTSDGTKVMVGTATGWTGGTLSLNVLSTTGSGSASAWLVDGVKALHSLARTLSFDTVLCSRAARDAEAMRLLGLYRSRRNMVKAVVHLVDALKKALIDLGTIEQILYARWGYGAGKNALTLDFILDVEADELTLGLFV